jgi:hypothetical protein
MLQSNLLFRASGQKTGGLVLFLRDAGNYHSKTVKSQSRNFRLCAARASTHRWLIQSTAVNSLATGLLDSAE